MSKMQEAVGGVKTFIEDVRTELKKCSWPTRPELFESTVVVIVSVLLVGIYVGTCDVLLNGFLRFIVR